MNNKRIFDVFLAIFLIVIFSPLFFIISVLIYAYDGMPIFYLSERMSGVNKSFILIKFRTMRPSLENTGVSGGDKTDRITRPGKFLRKTRLDEIPQLLNILKGDMSFIGPRPPLRIYVERFPDLYSRILVNPPGVTGLASIYYHKMEETLLLKCANATETDKVYSNRCIPRKAKLDMIYIKNRSICFDIKLLFLTVRKVFF